jgi:hypothetical protein
MEAFGKLQWGRGFAATEGRRPASTASFTSSFNGAVASQPRKAAGPDGPGGGCRGFNRAVASQPRKAGAELPERRRRLASMGPWLRSHGRVLIRGWAWGWEALQWGRGFAATEGLGAGADAGHEELASMGPWLRSHGRGGLRSRFLPKAESAVCEHLGIPSTSSNRSLQHGLRKPFRNRGLASRERPRGFSHHVAARGGQSSKPDCQGSTSQQRLTAS